VTQLSLSRRRGTIASRAVGFTAAAISCILLAACGGSSEDNVGPLISDNLPGGFISCLEAPDPGTSIVSWRTQVGFALDVYFNRSRRPLVIESVRLADAHGLIVHQALVYLIANHDKDPLPYERPWSQIGQGVPRSAWAHGHQAVPGAVIGPLDGSTASGPGAGNHYQVVVDLSARSAAGGWATGEIIRYRAHGHTYSVRSYTGYALAPPSGKPSCASQTKTIRAVFKAARLYNEG
jgi:hypothetical protein